MTFLITVSTRGAGAAPYFVEGAFGELQNVDPIGVWEDSGKNI